MLKSGAGSDRIIVCKDLTWMVYTFIMCPRSDDFTGACRSGFVESNTCQIDLFAEDPRLTSRMIRFLYTLEFEISVDTPLGNLEVQAGPYDLREFCAIKSLKAVAGWSIVTTYRETRACTAGERTQSSWPVHVFGSFEPCTPPRLNGTAFARYRPCISPARDEQHG